MRRCCTSYNRPAYKRWLQVLPSPWCNTKPCPGPSTLGRTAHTLWVVLLCTPLALLCTYSVAIPGRPLFACTGQLASSCTVMDPAAVDKVPPVPIGTSVVALYAKSTAVQSSWSNLCCDIPATSPQVGHLSSSAHLPCVQQAFHKGWSIHHQSVSIHTTPPTSSPAPHCRSSSWMRCSRMR